MYYYRKINEKGYVIHKETGVSLPYHMRLKHYEKEGVIPVYKLPFFMEWLCYSNGQRRRIKENEMKVCTTPCLVSCNPAPANVNIPMIKGRDIPEENTMRFNEEGFSVSDGPCGYSKSKTVNATGIIVQENSETETQRTFLNNRLYALRNDKYTELREFFGLSDMPWPSNAAELVKRIQDGMFVLPEKEKDYGTDSIRWRDPKKTEDHDGFAAAEETVTAAHTKVKEDIAIFPPEKGLESVRAFADTTFH